MANNRSQKESKAKEKRNVNYVASRECSSYLLWIKSGTNGFSNLLRAAFAEYGISKDVSSDTKILKESYLKLIHATASLADLEDKIWKNLEEANERSIGGIIPVLLVLHVHHPQNVAFIQQLAECWIRLAEFVKAEICLQQALALGENRDLTFSLLGDLKLQQGDFAAARSFYHGINAIFSEEEHKKSLVLLVCRLGELLASELKRLGEDKKYIVERWFISDQLNRCYKQEYQFTDRDEKELAVIFRENPRLLKEITAIFLQANQEVNAVHAMKKA